MASYVISDIHGQYSIFCGLLSKVKLSVRDKLFVLGDTIDRGPGSIEALMHIMKMPNARMLIGNHEAMMLMSVDPEGEAELTGSKANLWLYSNGGIETWQKYRILSKSERLRLLSWLRSCPLTINAYVDDKKFLLSHSYFDERYIDAPYSSIPEEIVWELVWKSPFRWDTYVSLNEYFKRRETVVIGHVPVQRIHNNNDLKSYRDNNLVVIDGGCAMAGYGNTGAICLKLDDMSEKAVSFRDIKKR